ncbi:MAG: sulfite exporter TauE/SafE family protein [SAR324 cluster bacterium]|nr:sulfite exporter TauE/SafE family protein [SAR324 cluster bacterium]
MIEWIDLPVLGAAALLSAFIGSVAGSGGSTVLLPVLVLYFGIRDAVPIITIANLAANLSRSVINRGEIVYPVVGWFTLGTVPASVLGAWLFTATPPEILTRLLGGLLISLVVWRRVRQLGLSPPRSRSAAWFLPLGTLFGFLEGLMGSVGPLMAPFFLAHGLMRGAYIGTDAFVTSVMQAIKLGVFGGARLVGPGILAAGLTLVPFMVLGTMLGKKMLHRVSDSVFSILLELVLVAAGLNFLIGG